MRLEARELSVLHGIVRQDACVARIRAQGRSVVFRDPSVLLQWSSQRHIGAMDRLRQRPDAMHPTRPLILHGPIQGPHFRPAHGSLGSLIASPAIEVENETRVGIGRPEFEAGEEPRRPGRDPEGNPEDTAELAR